MQCIACTSHDRHTLQVVDPCSRSNTLTFSCSSSPFDTLVWAVMKPFDTWLSVYVSAFGGDSLLISCHVSRMSAS
eukprot:6180473-Pleurochrysis_carterae.AAC.6